MYVCMYVCVCVCMCVCVCVCVHTSSVSVIHYCHLYTKRNTALQGLQQQKHRLRTPEMILQSIWLHTHHSGSVSDQQRADRQQTTYIHPALEQQQQQHQILRQNGTIHHCSQALLLTRTCRRWSVVASARARVSTDARKGPAERQSSKCKKRVRSHHNT
jgi:hypothetical protein